MSKPGISSIIKNLIYFTINCLQLTFHEIFFFLAKLKLTLASEIENIKYKWTGLKHKFQFKVWSSLIFGTYISSGLSLSLKMPYTAYILEIKIWKLGWMKCLINTFLCYVRILKSYCFQAIFISRYSYYFYQIIFFSSISLFKQTRHSMVLRIILV